MDRITYRFAHLVNNVRDDTDGPAENVLDDTGHTGRVVIDLDAPAVAAMEAAQSAPAPAPTPAPPPTPPARPLQPLRVQSRSLIDSLHGSMAGALPHASPLLPFTPYGMAALAAGSGQAAPDVSCSNPVLLGRPERLNAPVTTPAFASTPLLAHARTAGPLFDATGSSIVAELDQALRADLDWLEVCTGLTPAQRLRALETLLGNMLAMHPDDPVRRHRVALLERIVARMAGLRSTTFVHMLGELALRSPLPPERLEPLLLHVAALAASLPTSQRGILCAVLLEAKALTALRFELLLNELLVETFPASPPAAADELACWIKVRQAFLAQPVTILCRLGDCMALQLSTLLRGFCVGQPDPLLEAIGKGLLGLLQQRAEKPGLAQAGPVLARVLDISRAMLPELGAVMVFEVHLSAVLFCTADVADAFPHEPGNEELLSPTTRFAVLCRFFRNGLDAGLNPDELFYEMALLADQLPAPFAARFHDLMETRRPGAQPPTPLERPVSPQDRR
ncbi:MAG: hypothetical protein ACRYGK_06835, partial [Janthinobacterium lividum]